MRNGERENNLPAVRPTAQLDIADTTVAAAAVSRSKAEVEAAFVVAKRFPRDYDDARARILKTCSRSRFAENKSTLYKLPQMKSPMPGIRLAEELTRELGNIQARTEVIDESADRLVIRAVAVDLQTNMRHEQDVVIKKTIERRSRREGQVVIGQRVTSKGDTVYIIEATDEEVFTKTNAAGSKALRNCLLRLCPADLVDEAIAAVEKTRRARAESDPDAYKKQVLDAFREINVMPSQLAEHLGHSIDQCSPAELTDLRTLWQSIDSGETTWSSIMSGRGSQPDKGEFDTDGMEAGDEGEHEGHEEAKEPVVGAMVADMLLTEIGLDGETPQRVEAYTSVIRALNAPSIELLGERLISRSVAAMAVDGIGPAALKTLSEAVNAMLDARDQGDAPEPEIAAGGSRSPDPADPVPTNLLTRLDTLYATQSEHFDASLEALGLAVEDSLEELSEDDQLRLYADVKKRIDGAD